MAVIPVELAGRSYEVRVGSGLLADVANQCGRLLRKPRVPVVTDANVAVFSRRILLLKTMRPFWRRHTISESATSSRSSRHSTQNPPCRQ